MTGPRRSGSPLPKLLMWSTMPENTTLLAIWPEMARVSIWLQPRNSPMAALPISSTQPMNSVPW